MNNELEFAIENDEDIHTSMVGRPHGSVAVIANFYAGIFGGPLSQLLKCLTAVKVCAEFKKNGVAAVPVCLVRQDAPPGFSSGEIHLIDRGSKLRCLKSAGWEKGTPGTGIEGNEAERLFEEIEKIFPDCDSEVLSALKEAFSPDRNPVSACAHWIKYLLKDFNVNIVEYDIFSADQNSGCSVLPNLTLPVTVFVADSAEIAEYGKAPPEKEGVPRPIVRPCPDVTISNARSLKTLKRYGLDFTRLFEGKESVMAYVRETMKSDISDRLQKLRDEVQAVFDEMEATAFAACGERSRRIRKARTARIIYQIEKIRRHSRDALANKEKAAENRIRKACDFLAPLARRQQDALGGAQIPLSFGLSGLRALFDGLDIATQNHQLIEMN